jgi:EAL and modified HD-GYP domain-containing signal transduction protein
VTSDAEHGAPNGTAGCDLIRRQAVFDARERLAGYELLLDCGVPPEAGADAAAVLAAAFGDLGLRRVVGDHRAYVTAPFDVLSGAAALRLPASQLVLHVTPQPVDDRLLGLVGGLVAQGFGVGVGGWALEPDAEPLVRLATAVKVDFDFGTRDLTQAVTQRDALHAQGATLIAAHVQTRGEHEEARRLGFDAFQGAYLAEPAGIAGRRTPTQRMAALAAVLSATGPGAFEDLERLIVQDAGLSHRFLHLAGSAFYASRARVRSVRDALARLGAEAVRRWALMLVLAGLADSTSDTARHLLGIGLHRARICELLAGQEPDADPDRSFSAGLLSILPGLVDQTMQELVAELPLDEPLARALTEHEGREGRILAAAIAYEEGEREGAGGDPPLLAAITRIYTDALLWADDTGGWLR